MEYVHTVLFQIAATKVDDADRLFAELESHRAIASAQRGFRGMRISRTAHPEGNLQVVVETRWASNNDMADYSALSDNVVSIVNKHEDLLVPGSVQVHRMEAVAGAKAEAPTRVYDRLALALFVPVGVLAFALVVIYGLSRIYLALPTDAATIFAASAAIVILALAFYFAMNPSVPRWQLAGVFVVGIAALGIGGTAAAIYDDNHKEMATPEASATPTTGGTPAPPGQVVLEMEDNEFLETELSVSQGAEVQIQNHGSAIHNVHVAQADGTFTTAFCQVGGEALCSDPDTIAGGETGVLIVNIAPGEYDYRCDFHPTEMKGVLTVQ